MDDAIPVTPDGKINWPTFYQSLKLNNRFTAYAAMGACRGQKKSIVNMLVNNQVDIDKLGVSSVDGRAVAIKDGLVMMMDTSGQPLTVVTHPAGVSRVKVEGDMPVAGLLPGVMVRLQARVDGRGHGVEEITKLDVFTPEANFKFPTVFPGRLQSLAGQVVSLRGKALQLKTPSGDIRRLVFLLNDECQVRVDAKDFGLIFPGDTLKVTGHVYSGEGVGTKTVFADDIEVTKVYGQSEVSSESSSVDSLSAATP